MSKTNLHDLIALAARARALKCYALWAATVAEIERVRAGR